MHSYRFILSAVCLVLFTHAAQEEQEGAGLIAAGLGIAAAAGGAGLIGGLLLGKDDKPPPAPAPAPIQPVPHLVPVPVHVAPVPVHVTPVIRPVVRVIRKRRRPKVKVVHVPAPAPAPKIVHVPVPAPPHSSGSRSSRSKGSKGSKGAAVQVEEVVPPNAEKEGTAETAYSAAPSSGPWTTVAIVVGALAVATVAVILIVQRGRSSSSGSRHYMETRTPRQYRTVNRV